MNYDQWIFEEVVLNCKEQDLEDYFCESYVEMVIHEIFNSQSKLAGEQLK